MVTDANQLFSWERDQKLWMKCIPCDMSFPKPPSVHYHILEKWDYMLYLLRIINMFFLVQKALYLLLSSLSDSNYDAFWAQHVYFRWLEFTLVRLTMFFRGWHTYVVFHDSLELGREENPQNQRKACITLWNSVQFWQRSKLGNFPF